jgi:ketosteroid isomerase-like protein
MTFRGHSLSSMPRLKSTTFRGLPDASIYHGHQGYLDQIAKFREAFSEMTYEPLEFIDVGDKVVSVIRATGVAKVGGIKGEATYAQVETWRDGKIVVIQYFLSKNEALEAAGLRG